MVPQDLLSYYSMLKSHAIAWEEERNTAAKWCNPRRYNDISTNNAVANVTPDFSINADVMDPIGQQCAFDAAASMLNWTTPMSGNWLKAGLPRALKNLPTSRKDEIEKYLLSLSEAANDAISDSNYYVTAFAINHDLMTSNTICLYNEFVDGQFRFRSEPSFVCALGAREEIDIVFVPKHYTHYQAAEEFGIDNIPEKIRALARDPRRWHETNEYIHCMLPNPDANPAANPPTREQMPWTVAWLHFESKRAVGDWYGKTDIKGGAMRPPYIVSGFLPSSRRNPNAPYFWGPALMAIPDLKQLNAMVKAGDGAIEYAAFPSVFLPKSLKGRINLRPRGHNQLADMNEMPKFLETNSRVDWVLMRAEQLRESIREKFLIPLFNQFKGVDLKDVTAEAIRAKLGEQENLLPVFGLVMFDYLTKLGKELFADMLRAGQWPKPIPQELYNVDGGIRLPRIKFSNKLTQILELTQAMSTVQAVAENAQLAQATGNAAMLDPYDLREVGLANYRARNGLADCLLDQAEEEELQAQRGALQAAMMEAQAAQQQAPS